MKKIGLMKSKKFVIYGKTDLVLMMIIKKCHKVRDHCHNTGKSRVAAHEICNLKYKTPKEIPVLFHYVLCTIITL